MMIHECHKIVGKTKTRQEKRLKNKNIRFVHFYLTGDSFKITLRDNHNFPIFRHFAVH